jgi:hypothetical protein
VVIKAPFMASHRHPGALELVGPRERILSRPLMAENELDSEAAATPNSPADGAVAREGW